MVEGVLVIKKGREKYKAVCDRLLGKDVLIVICAGEDVACIGTDRDDGAFEDTRMIDDHPLRGGTLVGQFSDMDIVQPRLENAVAF